MASGRRVVKTQANGSSHDTPDMGGIMGNETPEEEQIETQDTSPDEVADLAALDPVELMMYRVLERGRPARFYVYQDEPRVASNWRANTNIGVLHFDPMHQPEFDLYDAVHELAGDGIYHVAMKWLDEKQHWMMGGGPVDLGGIYRGKPNVAVERSKAQLQLAPPPATVAGQQQGDPLVLKLLDVVLADRRQPDQRNTALVGMLEQGLVKIVNSFLDSSTRMNPGAAVSEAQIEQIVNRMIERVKKAAAKEEGWESVFRDALKDALPKLFDLLKTGTASQPQGETAARLPGPSNSADGSGPTSSPSPAQPEPSDLAEEMKDAIEFVYFLIESETPAQSAAKLLKRQYSDEVILTMQRLPADAIISFVKENAPDYWLAFEQHRDWIEEVRTLL